VAQRRFHYEQAFEHYLRANRAPYVAVDEAKKALIPAGDVGPVPTASIKSFDFVVYAPRRNLLIDVKGRMFGRARSAAGHLHYDSWATLGDVDGLERWQRLFGPDFEAVFVFIYCLRQQPPDALFEEIFEFASRWYCMREVRTADYRSAMVPRSEKWGTVHLPAAAMRRLSRPFSIRPHAIGPAPEGPAAPAAPALSRW
jgi:hypothetical protein